MRCERCECPSRVVDSQHHGTGQSAASMCWYVRLYVRLLAQFIKNTRSHWHTTSLFVSGCPYNCKVKIPGNEIIKCRSVLTSWTTSLWWKPTSTLSGGGLAVCWSEKFSPLSIRYICAKLVWHVDARPMYLHSSSTICTLISAFLCISADTLSL